MRVLGQGQRADRVWLVEPVGGQEAEEGRLVGLGLEQLAGLVVMAQRGQRAGAEILPFAVLLLAGGHRVEAGQHRAPVLLRQRHAHPPFAGAVGLCGGGQGDQPGQCAVVEIGGVIQRQGLQDAVALRFAETEARLQFLPGRIGAAGLASGQPDQRQRGGLPLARAVGPGGGGRQRGGRVAQRQYQLLRGGAFGRGQPGDEAGDGAGLAGIGGAVDPRPQARIGQQALVVRGGKHRTAGVGQVRLGPQAGQVPLEIQCAAAGQSRLQGVAGQRVAEAGLVQREERAPVLPARQLPQERTAQVGGGDPVRVLREVRLHAGAVDLLDVVLQRRGLQVRIQRVVAQAAGQRSPAVAALLGGGIRLPEGGALGGVGFGGMRHRTGQQPAGGQQQPGQRNTPR